MRALAGWALVAVLSYAFVEGMARAWDAEMPYDRPTVQAGQ